MANEFLKFIDEFESKVIDLSKELNLAYFNATVSGKEEDYKKTSELQLQLSKIYSDKKSFAALKQIKESGEITDPVQQRQLILTYNAFAGNQFNEKLLEEIITLSTKVEEKFSTFRADIDGKKYTDNQIDEILEKSNDSTELQKAWLSSKQIGQVVAGDVLKLVKMRNKAAAELGYKNYHQMSLTLSEQNADEIEKLFDELDSLTRNEFAKLKTTIDEYLEKKTGVKKENLRPWHYQDKFFQHGPKIYEVDLDSYYSDKDIAAITTKYYDSIGMDISDLIEHSDLYEKEGKYQHAYCMNIDRNGDVRVLCNIKPKYKWMSTMLHEYGHAVYDKFISHELPWEVREPAHIFATEAIAMLFGRFASNPQWLCDVIGISEDEKKKIADKCFSSLKLEQLAFSRWVQVMYRFEKAMYEDPDQDLNNLWWQLVEKYQMLKRPENRNEPDWASKIHVALYPAYYHNYMLGELLASQLYYFVKENILKNNSSENISFVDNKNIGKFFIEEYFVYGSQYHWSELIKKATGNQLTPAFYAKQFVGN